MAKYAYPAIFTPEVGGRYSVIFPDIAGCYTCGDNLEDAINMAEDALALVLCGYETDKKTIPTPSPISSLHIRNDEFAYSITCDSILNRKLQK